ncbi:PREDICTED: cinnamoyl-CoA reductase-like SNL6 [Tarenaya hassleriana]|uniref:cinnamoyl-CoA reductase-like SNL6 n=1 Tax=Tarenaya hassleriana TaxID=28532 RepID=UPI00053C2357|nr:PREDICTED: cinnamoyl-CoA reductase-like SNL6 [Tarenaya hassleriana]
MRILRTSDEFAAELQEFMCAAVQRRKDDDGLGGARGGKSRNLEDLDSDGGNRLVCVTGGVSYLGRAVVERLLIHGYSVRIVVASPEEEEQVREMGISGETASFNNRISAVMARLTDIGSLIQAFDGCFGVFHTSAFIDQAGISGYSKSMAELEAKVSEAVIEACTRTGSVRKCVFTSSLLACIWQDGSLCDLPAVVNDECWSQEQVCTQKKLWYALGKLKAEKAAWRIAGEKGLKLATICPALITGPDFFPRNPTSTLAYLKGAEEMYGKGVLATVDVKRVAKAHVFLFEGMNRASASGRYICFDNVVMCRHSAEKLAKVIGINPHKLCGHSGHPPSSVLSDKKLLHLMSRTLTSCSQQT